MAEYQRAEDRKLGSAEDLPFCRKSFKLHKRTNQCMRR